MSSPCLIKKKQMLRSVLYAAHRKELERVVLVDDNPYASLVAMKPSFKPRTFTIGKTTRDEVMAELFDISLTNWIISGMSRSGRKLEIRFSEINQYKVSNIDADVVNWISLLFKPEFKSRLERCEPLSIYICAGEKLKFFSDEELESLKDRLLFL